MKPSGVRKIDDALIQKKYTINSRFTDSFFSQQAFLEKIINETRHNAIPKL
jgi:hypothetical protein